MYVVILVLTLLVLKLKFRIFRKETVFIFPTVYILKPSPTFEIVINREHLEQAVARLGQGYGKH